jgi:hypothetical protein
MIYDLEYTFSYFDDTKRSVTLKEDELEGVRVLYTVVNEEGVIIKEGNDYYIVWDDGTERTKLGTDTGYAIMDNAIIL